MRWPVLLVLISVAAGRPASAQTAVRIVEDGVTPASILPGAPAHRTLRVEAPDGVRVRVDPASPPGAAAEATGEVRVARAVTESGAVLWTFHLPFTGWAPGQDSLASVGVRWQGMGLEGATMSEAAVYSVEDPLPEGGHPPPAPMEGSLPQSGVRWDLFPLAPLALAGLTGAGWWRAGRREPGAVPVEDPSAVRVEPVDVDRLLAAALSQIEVDVGEAVLRMAEAARALPAEWGVPVHPSMTPREVAIALRDLEGIAPVAVLVNLLYMADAWQFGRQLPPADVLRGIGESLRVGVPGA